MNEKCIDRDFVISGIHAGERSFDVEHFLEEVGERCIASESNFVMIRADFTEEDVKPEGNLCKWAKFLAEQKIYFAFLYSIDIGEFESISRIPKKTISKIKEIAGEYFLGDTIAERSGDYACKERGYFGEEDGLEMLPPQNLTDMQKAKDNYIEMVKRLIKADNDIGLDREYILSVEQNAFNSYNLEAGAGFPMVEVFQGNPEIQISFTRGAARAYKTKGWGTYFAHEWYAGMFHDDELKKKRLELAYKYGYLAGSNLLVLESGDEEVNSYGRPYTKESEVCANYRRVVKNAAKFIKKDIRPSGGPCVKVAFVQGNCDSWGGAFGSTSWNQFNKKSFAYSYPEYSWRVLDEIGKKRSWTDVKNYGEKDTSALPAYGQYDVIPATSNFETMKKYDYLIFAGWNTMNEEIYNTLHRYVENGGTLLIAVAHLNTNPERDGKMQYIFDGKVDSLFGCSLGEIYSENKGVKFEKASVTNVLRYPYTNSLTCDPIFPAGFVNYAKVKISSGSVAANLHDEFFYKNKSEQVSIVENKVGKGVAILMASVDYPGHPAVFPLYSAMVREIISASQRACDVKVFSNDTVRYAVYNNKMYLLNTDFDVSAKAHIEINNEKSIDIELAPLELKPLDI